MRSLVNASQIDLWFNSMLRDAQELLPDTLRRLIWAAVPIESLKEINIPVGDQIGQRGYDGTVKSSRQYLFVPRGRSVWETGTGEPEAKANDDYRKRTDKASKTFRMATTFVFATPHIWPGKDAWREDVLNRKEWRDVRVLHAVDLEAWLLGAPVVARWLAQQFGVPIHGLRDIDFYVKEAFEAVYGLELNPELIIGGRVDSARRLREWMASGNREVGLFGESVDEGAAFVSAVVRGMDRIERGSTESRLVYVDSPDALDHLTTIKTTHIVVALTTDVIHRVRALDEPLIRVVAAMGPGAWDGLTTTIELGTLVGSAIEPALSNVVGSTRRASLIAHDSKGSLTAMLLMAANRSDAPPDWSQGDGAAELAPLLLLQQWNGQVRADRDVVEAMCVRTYEDIEHSLIRWEVPRGPLRRRGSMWEWMAWDYAWQNLIERVTPSVIERFTEVCRNALGERDPALDIAADDRWGAVIHGKVRPHSNGMLDGLVAALLRLAVRTAGSSVANRTAIVNRIVHELMAEEKALDVDTWLSLGRWLPSLAESAPTIFLDAIALFARNGRSVGDLFSGGGHFARYGFVEVCWALGRLSWSGEWLSRVVLVLGGLAENDPDPNSNYSGRPSDTLTRILLPWYPQTEASVQERLDAIDLLLDRHPSIGWGLLVSLLPGRVSFALPISEPELRQWKKDGERRTSILEYTKYQSAIVVKSIEHAGISGPRWAQLVEAFPQARERNPEWSSNILDSLNNLDLQSLPDGDREILRASILELIRHHRDFPEAKWAMPESELSPFDLLYKQLEPVGLIERYRSLFGHWPTILNSRKYDYDEHMRDVGEERKMAILQIYHTQGIAGILRFSAVVEMPDEVGVALASLSIDPVAEGMLFSQTLECVPERLPYPARLRVGWGYVGRRYQEHGNSWVDEVFARSNEAWSPVVYANFAAGMPPVEATWDLIERFGQEAHGLYWKWAPIYRLENPDRDLERSLNALIKAGRLWRAFDLMCLYIRDKSKDDENTSELLVPSELAIRILTQVARQPLDGAIDRPGPHVTGYQISRVLDALEHRGVDIETLGRLEWVWLAVLDSEERGPNALQILASNDPSLFVDLLNLAYRSKDEEEIQPDESQMAMAMQAYRLLKKLDRVPGTLTLTPPESKAEGDIVFPGGLVDRETHFNWVTKARELAIGSGRLGVFDISLGNVLAHAPHEADGTWPCIAVRDLIEHLQSDDLDQGINTGVFNKRGVYSGGNGGVQERAIAEKFRGFESAVRSKWPRTGAMLGGIAESFASLAAREGSDLDE